MLPFAKGKGVDILLLDKKFILRNGIFNISYLFPIYFSTFYFSLFYLYYLRNRLFFKGRAIILDLNSKVALALLSLFIISTAISSIFSIFDIPIILASLQVVVLLFVFLMPFFLAFSRKQLNNLYLMIASSTIFQSIWLILQTINKGHLNRDLEVFLPGAEFGIRSSENQDLPRLTGTFFESSILGTFLLTNLTILALALVNRRVKNIKNQQIILFAVIIGLIATLLTGSRAIYGFILISLIMIAYIGNYLSRQKIQTFLKSLVANKAYLAILVLGIIFVSPYLFSRLSSTNQVFSKEGSGTYRIQLSQMALRLTDKKPLLGVGLDLSPYYLATSFPQENYFVDPAHPHNLIIQLLAETGIVGTALFSLFVYMIFRPSLKKSFKKINEFLLGSLIFFLCAMIYPIFINQMEIISYFFLYLGFGAYLSQTNANKNN